MGRFKDDSTLYDYGVKPRGAEYNYFNSLVGEEGGWDPTKNKEYAKRVQAVETIKNWDVSKIKRKNGKLYSPPHPTSGNIRELTQQEAGEYLKTKTNLTDEDMLDIRNIVQATPVPEGSIASKWGKIDILRHADRIDDNKLAKLVNTLHGTYAGGIERDSEGNPQNAYLRDEMEPNRELLDNFYTEVASRRGAVTTPTTVEQTRGGDEGDRLWTKEYNHPSTLIPGDPNNPTQTGSEWPLYKDYERDRPGRGYEIEQEGYLHPGQRYTGHGVPRSRSYPYLPMESVEDPNRVYPGNELPYETEATYDDLYPVSEEMQNRAMPIIQKGADALNFFDESLTPNPSEQVPTTGFESTLSGFMEKLGNLQMTMFNNIKNFAMSDKNPLSGVGEGIASTLARQNPVTNEIPGGIIGSELSNQARTGFDAGMQGGMLPEELFEIMSPGPKVPK